ncbi:hypothetical protein ACIF8T_37170 [Streptomyces sp. NPDC085946]|uniref:hypothetical protein n=1 Tax=Streptomyces sp. NPDC085946 TaxID=3365744 RepID=UPI0037D2796C
MLDPASEDLGCAAVDAAPDDGEEIVLRVENMAHFGPPHPGTDNSQNSPMDETRFRRLIEGDLLAGVVEAADSEMHDGRLDPRPAVTGCFRLVAARSAEAAVVQRGDGREWLWHCVPWCCSAPRRRFDRTCRCPSVKGIARGCLPAGLPVGRAVVAPES